MRTRDSDEDQEISTPTANAVELANKILDNLSGGLGRLHRAWPRAAGELVAQYTLPSRLAHGVLTVTCADASWASEVQLQAAQYRERLNAQLGDDSVREIHCRVGRVPGRR